MEPQGHVGQHQKILYSCWQRPRRKGEKTLIEKNIWKNNGCKLAKLGKMIQTYKFNKLRKIVFLNLKNDWTVKFSKCSWE